MSCGRNSKVLSNETDVACGEISVSLQLNVKAAATVLTAVAAFAVPLAAVIDRHLTAANDGGVTIQPNDRPAFHADFARTLTTLAVGRGVAYGLEVGQAFALLAEDVDAHGTVFEEISRILEPHCQVAALAVAPVAGRA